MKLNGCWGHKPYADTFGSYGLDSRTGEIRYFELPNPNKKDCSYQTTALGRNDRGCFGCVWRVYVLRED